MMQSDKCKCPHHWVTKLLRLLALISAILFLWTTWRSGMVLGFSSGIWFEHFVVFVLMVIGIKGGCKCCCGEKHCNTCSVDSKQSM